MENLLRDSSGTSPFDASPRTSSKRRDVSVIEPARFYGPFQRFI
jgi:hypothetical protein